MDRLPSRYRSESEELTDGDGDPFYEKQGIIRENLEEITEEILRIRAEVDEYNRDPKRTLDTKKELDLFNNRVGELKTKFHALREEFAAMAPYTRPPADVELDEATKKEYASKADQFKVLGDKVVETMSRLNSLQAEMSGNIRKKVSDMVSQLSGDSDHELVLTDEQLGAVMDIGLDQFVQAQIGSSSAEIDALLDRAVSRYQGVVRLAQSITQLGQMCRDFAVLVEHQGEMLERVKDNVESAALDVEQGKEDLQKGLEAHKKSKKKKKIVIIILLVVVVVIAVIATSVSLTKS